MANEIYRQVEYGHIEVKLREMIEEKGITRNKLRDLTGIKYDVINRYYKAESIEKLDLDVFSRICFVLDCNISDLLVYKKPE